MKQKLRERPGSKRPMIKGLAVGDGSWQVSASHRGDKDLLLKRSSSCHGDGIQNRRAPATAAAMAGMATKLTMAPLLGLGAAVVAAVV